jgi:PAS domain S-box-containing protein
MTAKLFQYDIKETLYESESTIVYRGYRAQDHLPVILKILKLESADQQRAISYRHEFDILSKLDLPGVVKALALEEYNDGLVMTLKDIGGDSLYHILKKARLPLTQSIELMIALTDTVGLVHKNHIIHNDINPSNIVYNLETKEVNLIDFDLADEIPERSITPQPPLAIKGTLDYISPEQTGRMNRPVDYRTDFYSLGATFYRMLTGRVPFEADDALGIIYSHIAKIPLAPRELDSNIPEMLSLIVMKLLSKMADDRYQSTWGLKVDLVKCLERMTGSGSISKFVLAQDDLTDRLYIPQNLYGRERELSELLQALNETSAGKRELFLVGGYAGVGKTRFVREIHKTILEKQGYFVEGKFEQLQRNVPYLGWTQAFEALANYILMESETELVEWKQKIQKAVGNIGRVLTDVIPSLELIIGAQPEVPELGGIEAQNRFNYVFLEFVKAIATREHPLVVFLDDLQWIESASLKLLETLMTSEGVSNVLLIGAYRDNEVDDLHSLTKSIEMLREQNADIALLTLDELSEFTVNSIVADTLHHDRSETDRLSRLIYSKTGGNPFFLLQTLRALVERQNIFFDGEARTWRWDSSAIEKMGITDNVVSLMAAKILQLPLETQHLLQLAACMGYKFGVRNLSIIARLSEDVTLEMLQPTIREGLIVAATNQYQFAHDRVQQAAYTLIPVEERPARHLAIGWLLLENVPEDKLTENVFDIVDQLNRGASLITERSERKRLAELNHIAGKQAKASAAFALAVNYFAAGTTLLDTSDWEESYDLAFSLYTKLAECEFLVGNFDGSEKVLYEVLENARSLLDRALIYRMFQRLYQLSARWPEAVTAALRGLELLGVTFPESDNEIRIATEAEKKQIQVNLRGRQIAELADAPFTDNAETQVLIGLLAESITQFFITRPVLWHLVVLRCVNLCLERGYVDETPYIFGSYCKMLVALYNDISSAFEFSQMALKLNERLPKGGPMRGLPPFYHASVIGFWRQHFKTNLPLFDQAFQAFLDSGDINWASYLTYNAIWLHFENGEPLEQIIELARHYAAFNQRIHNDIVYDVDRAIEQFAAGLRGRTQSLTNFDDASFDEAACIAAIEHAKFGIGVGYYRIIKLIAAYIAEQYDEALMWANQVEPVLASVSSMAIWGSYYFYLALTKAALYEKADAEQKREIMVTLTDISEKLKFWANNCPENFTNRNELIDAEIARIENRDQDAMRHYEAAILSAHANGFPHNEAIANEVASRFYKKRGFDKIARTYLIEALNCYSRWGADGKTRQLMHRHPRLATCSISEGSSLTERLDAISLAKAQQAISSKIEMDNLLNEIMHIVIENACAQSGFLLFERNEVWQIVAKGGIHTEEIETSLPISIDDSDLVARSVVRFVARTKESVILDDAANLGEFERDPHIKQERTKSLMCAPLLNRGRLIGILYLENNLTTQAFSPERVQLLEMLSSQAAISLENARFYEVLRESEAKFRSLIFKIQTAVILHDGQGRILISNPMAQRLLGLSEDQLLGKELVDPNWHFVKEDGSIMPVSEYPVSLVLASGRPLRDYITGIYNPARSEIIWTLVNAEPDYNEAGVIERIIASFVDITDRIRAEEHQRDFYRRTILAATEGKLQLTEKDEIEDIAGQAIAVFKVENAEDFRNARAAILRIARSMGMDEVRAGDYRTAVGEAITNAAKHANGGIVSIHILPEAILTVVSDRGPGIEAMSIPEVALKKGYTTAGTLGMGYKVMTSIVDKVYLATGPWGTIVGLEINIKPSEITPNITDIYHALT